MDNRLAGMNKFLEIYGTLPRAGPGSNELTRAAFQLMEELPESPAILDLGCGPGMQTVELLRLCRGTVVALDLLPEMLIRVRAAAQAAGVADRLQTLEQDVADMAFPEHSFDIIWAEASIYLLGFEAGLQKLGRFLRPGGYIAVSEVIWLRPDPPAELLEFWSQYPEIDFMDAKLAAVDRAGYALVGQFPFPSTAWTEDYYDPMARRVEAMAVPWRADPEGEAVLAEARNEIAIYRSFREYFNYAFFVLRKPL